jgi:hypothetical protein
MGGRYEWRKSSIACRFFVTSAGRNLILPPVFQAASEEKHELLNGSTDGQRGGNNKDTGDRFTGLQPLVGGLRNGIQIMGD